MSESRMIDDLRTCTTCYVEFLPDGDEDTCQECADREDRADESIRQAEAMREARDGE
jgi:hypothetical protein